MVDNYPNKKDKKLTNPKTKNKKQKKIKLNNTFRYYEVLRKTKASKTYSRHLLFFLK